MILKTSSRKEGMYAVKVHNNFSARFYFVLQDSSWRRLPVPAKEELAKFETRASCQVAQDEVSFDFSLYNHHYESQNLISAQPAVRADYY